LNAVFSFDAVSRPNAFCLVLVVLCRCAGRFHAALFAVELMK